MRYYLGRPLLLALPAAPRGLHLWVQQPVLLAIDIECRRERAADVAVE